MEMFSALLALCAGNSLVTGEFPSQKSVTQSFHVLFDPHLNKSWINNRDPNDLRCDHVYYDVAVLRQPFMDLS